MDVVAYGPALHDGDSYYPMRRFDSLAYGEESQDAFHASHEWREAPREVTLTLIENYTEVVLELDDVTVQGFRKAQPAKKTHSQE